MRKLKRFSFAALALVMSVLTVPTFAFASGGDATAVTPASWSTVIDAVTGTFSVSSIVAVIASVVSAGIVFVFLWWGVRMAFRSLMGAVKNGTLSISGRSRRRGR